MTTLELDQVQEINLIECYAKFLLQMVNNSLNFELEEYEFRTE